MTQKEICPCCGHLTLDERGNYDICPVCFWEDDGNNELNDPSGPNNCLTLAEAKDNYKEFGACESMFKKDVREPYQEEINAKS